MKKSNLNVTTVVLLFTVLAQPSFAYKTIKAESPIKIEKMLDLAIKRDLNLLHEKKEKDEIEVMRRDHPLEFVESLKETATNPPDRQSQLMEVRDGRKKVEQAKLIAMNQLFEVVQKDRELLLKSSLNDQSAPDWNGFQPILKRKLKEILYLSKEMRGQEIVYKFGVQEWGLAQVIEKNGKFEVVKTQIDINSLRDENPLEPGADKIKISQ